MREYGLSFESTMALPIKAFWFLYNQIDRLRAEQEMRQLQLIGASGSEEGFKMGIKNLTEEMGQVYVWEDNGPNEVRVDAETGLDPEFDREGLRALKAMSEQKTGQTV